MILSCQFIANRIKEEVKERLRKIETGVPHLVSIRVGEHKDAEVYTKVQRKLCKEIGIEYSLKQFKDSVCEDELLSFIRHLNKDRRVNGIIVHLPLPEHIRKQKVFSSIEVEKDVEGMHTCSDILPCTPLAIMEILKYTKVKLKGREVVVVGSGDCVGKPLFPLLLERMPTLTVCNIATHHLSLHTQRADILIVGIGEPNFIQPEMVKKGAVVIDAGINYLNGRIVGDVDRRVENKAKFLTPVPGGVGVVTSAILMRNTLKCFLKQMRGRRDG
ncbi:MAG: bifunctional methylenetetrahydrofolate dehydrogenase/methenyltetrahydrofolate cyclohydrolase [Candidatus Omnitrophota bacterium]|nr:MAG: bifunctional methylenetetrahydrofolate dehydrogenase/methenyltetrahydrofolate cyclohydrolase [Candidatus Omnitrophota bacterium]